MPDTLPDSAIPRLDRPPMQMHWLEDRRDVLTAYYMVDHVAKYCNVPFGAAAPGSLPYLQIEAWIIDHAQRWEMTPETWDALHFHVCDYLHGAARLPEDVFAALHWARDPEAVKVSTRPIINQVATYARCLQEVVGDVPFFLACRTVARWLPISHEYANQALNLLVQYGVLEMVDPGDRTKARSYRFLGELTQNLEPTTQEHTTNARAREVDSVRAYRPDSSRKTRPEKTPHGLKVVARILAVTGEGPEYRDYWYDVGVRMRDAGESHAFLRQVERLEAGRDEGGDVIRLPGPWLTSTCKLILGEKPMPRPPARAAGAKPPESRPQSAEPPAGMKTLGDIVTAEFVAKLLAGAASEKAF